MTRVVGFFQDEADEEGMDAGYYIVSMVINDMSGRIDSHISDYEARFRASRLVDIPFQWLSQGLVHHACFVASDLAASSLQRAKMSRAVKTFRSGFPPVCCMCQHLFRAL